MKPEWAQFLRFACVAKADDAMWLELLRRCDCRYREQRAGYCEYCHDRAWYYRQSQGLPSPVHPKRV
jgi:hypothetical protein